MADWIVYGAHIGVTVFVAAITVVVLAGAVVGIASLIGNLIKAGSDDD